MFDIITPVMKPPIEYCRIRITFAKFCFLVIIGLVVITFTCITYITSQKSTRSFGRITDDHHEDRSWDALNRITVERRENRSWEDLNRAVLDTSPGITAGGSWGPYATTRNTNVLNKITVERHVSRSWDVLSTDALDTNARIKAGGAWGLNTTDHVAITVPYRDREEHLKVFLKYLHPFLQRQQLNYTIYVIELQQHIPFNRGLLKNVGFMEAMKRGDYDCIISHDVDLIPEDYRIDYKCAKGNYAKHISEAIDIWNYTIIYPEIFGGVTAIRPEQFKSANGFPNTFFGWGAEDDALLVRLQGIGVSVVRPPVEIAQYTMLSHKKDTPNPEMRKFMKAPLPDRDGLNSLHYDILKTELRPLCTWILVSVNKTEIMINYRFGRQKLMRRRLIYAWVIWIVGLMFILFIYYRHRQNTDKSVPKIELYK